MHPPGAATFPEACRRSQICAFESTHQIGMEVPIGQQRRELDFRGYPQ
jgi:hypothetical protein